MSASTPVSRLPRRCSPPASSTSSGSSIGADDRRPWTTPPRRPAIDPARVDPKRDLTDRQPARRLSRDPLRRRSPRAAPTMVSTTSARILWVRRMGRLVVTEFMTVDGVMEAPGFDEHRSGRNAWALRLSDDDMQVFNRDQLRGRRRAPVRPDHVPDLGGVLAIAQGRGVVRPAGRTSCPSTSSRSRSATPTGTTRRSCAAIRPRRPRRSRPGSTASSSSTGARTWSRR